MKSEDDCFLAGKQTSVLKSRERHHSAKKGPYSQGYGLPSGHVWLWELDRKEGRAPKNWWLLKVPWTAGRSNRSILGETNPEYSLERLMMKLKLQYFGHLIQRVNPLEKSLMLGKTEGRGRRGSQRMRWLDSITDAIDMNVGRLQEMGRDREAWHASVHGVAESDTTGKLNNICKAQDNSVGQSNPSILPALPSSFHPPAYRPSLPLSNHLSSHHFLRLPAQLRHHGYKFHPSGSSQSSEGNKREI